jgi:hypothetical protein
MVLIRLRTLLSTEEDRYLPGPPSLIMLGRDLALDPCSNHTEGNAYYAPFEEMRKTPPSFVRSTAVLNRCPPHSNLNLGMLQFDLGTFSAVVWPS